MIFIIKQTAAAFLFILVSGALFAGTAGAYVDPYTGGMIASSVSTILAAALGFLSAGLVFFRSFLGRLLGNRVVRYMIYSALACCAAAAIYLFGRF